MGRQNEKGKQDVNFKKKSELTNDYNEYFIKIFLTLEEKRRWNIPVSRLRKLRQKDMYKMKVHMSKKFLN